MRQAAFFCACFFLPLCLAAQNAESAEDVVRDIIEELAEDGLLTDDADEAQDLVELAEDKLDLNAASRNDLARLHFLTPNQIKQILDRRELLGGFVAPSDLLTVWGFGQRDIERLMIFCEIGPRAYYYVADNDLAGRSEDTAAVGAWRANGGRPPHRVKGDVILRTARTLPKPKGFRNGKYLGGENSFLLRAGALLDKRFSAGFVAESDPGEPIASHGISTTDFTSAYLAYNDPNAMFCNAVLGHYSVRFGQGLGVWTGFSQDFTAARTSICRSGNGVAPTVSAAEYGYMRGVALGMAPRDSRFDVYFSDVDNDTVTLQSSGYHRTEAELRKRNRAALKTLGGYAQRFWRSGNAGVGANHWTSSVPMRESPALYQKFYPRGSRITTFHADYSQFMAERCRLYGEVAAQRSDGGVGVSFMQGLDVDLDGGNSLTVACRRFDRRYYPVVQNPFSRRGKPAGEEGLYMALQIGLAPRLGVLANMDLYRNGFPVYQKNFPTRGYKFRCKVTGQVSGASVLECLFRLDNGDESALADKNQKVEAHRAATKLAFTQTLSHFRARVTVEHTHYTRADAASAGGFWISGEAKAVFESADVSLVLAHFDTDNYDTRVYSYLPDVLYSMSVPSFSGRGVLAVAMLKAKFAGRVNFWLRGTYTTYYDRDVIGSGNQQIDADHRLDLRAQLQIKLYGSVGK